MLPMAKRALAIFEAPTPQGVRVPAEHGDHYAIYSFAPDLRVLNGFIQSLIGLYDYARLGADPRGTALFQAAEPEARAEVPTYDTGAWSLYSRGSSTHESTLSYHDLLQGFLAEPLHANEDRRLLHDRRPLRPVQERAAGGGGAAGHAARRARRAGCASRSRRSRTSTCGSRRAGKLVESRPFGAVGYGKRTFGWDVPRRAGTVHGAAERRATSPATRPPPPAPSRC